MAQEAVWVVGVGVAHAGREGRIQGEAVGKGRIFIVMGDPVVRRRHKGEFAHEGQFYRRRRGTAVAGLGINAVIEPTAEGRPRFTRGRIIRLGEVPLDIEDRDVNKTVGDFRPNDAIQPGGVVMDG